MLLSARCQVITPAWIEALLNEAQRPEVGVVGASLQFPDGTLAHAGYALVEGPQVVALWQGLSAEACAQEHWPLAARSCPAVCGACLMVRKDVFGHCGGLRLQDGADIDLCLGAVEAGQLVIWTPLAQLQISGIVAPDAGIARVLLARWPSAFGGRADSASAIAWLAQVQ
ncbi:hypothetical protein D3C75_796500 [compost metagenome]